MNNCNPAPTDGTVFLIDDWDDDGARFLTSVKYIDLEEEHGGGGLFVYADPIVSDIVPSGPEIPFNWYPMPEQYDHSKETDDE